MTKDKDEKGFKITLTQRAYQMGEALETLKERMSAIEMRTNILDNQIDIREAKYPLLENKIKSLEISTSRIQTIEDFIIDIRDQLKIISDERDALASKIEALNILRDELNEIKEIIIPDQVDFYNLSRQIEKLNQRLSLIESKKPHRLNFGPLNPLAIVGIASTIGIIAGQIISLIFFY